MNGPVDISPNHLDIVFDILHKHLPAGIKVWAFGSRANWTTKDSSDLDLALEGDSALDHGTIVALETAFEESILPYKVDIIDLNQVGDSFRRIVDAQKAPLGESGMYVSVRLKWREAPLGEIIEFKRGYDLPQRNRLPGDVPVVSSSGITDWHSEAKVKGPGVVAGQYGTLGGVYFIRGDFWPLNTALYVRDFKGNDPRFIGYFLRGLDFSACSDKTAVPTLNRNRLHEVIARYPTDIGEQRAIAHILGILDDKIDLNRQMNQTMEEMARALFKSWFVDFDPVRAKMDGSWLPDEPFSGAPDHLYDLFPANLVDSELGEVPKGWEVKELGEIAEQRRFGAKPAEIAPSTPYIALEHMPKRCITLSEWKTSESLAGGKYRFNRGDILFGKLRPYLHKVGVAPLAGVCSTDIVVISPLSQDWFGLILCHASSSVFIDYAESVSNGTKMPRTNWKDMSRYKITLPGRELAKAFTELIQPCINKIILMARNSHTLAAKRDALLPRLVSGELRTSNQV